EGRSHAGQGAERLLAVHVQGNGGGRRGRGVVDVVQTGQGEQDLGSPRGEPDGHLRGLQIAQGDPRHLDVQGRSTDAAVGAAEDAEVRQVDALIGQVVLAAHAANGVCPVLRPRVSYLRRGEAEVEALADGV